MLESRLQERHCLLVREMERKEGVERGGEGEEWRECNHVHGLLGRGIA